MKHRKRRGLSIMEVMVSALIMLWIVSILVSFTNMNSRLWQRGVMDAGTQADGQQAIALLARDIRAARSVVVASSTSTLVTLQLPSYDSSGNLIIPMTNGEVVAYYLSDSTGSTSVTDGTILWKSVNGTPDTTWSLGGSGGRTKLAASGLTFTYTPSSDPEIITVSATARSTSGSTTRDFVSTQQVVLRNHGL